jgi:hypothetical protein
MNKENLITLIDKLEKDIESIDLEKLSLKDKFFMLQGLILYAEVYIYRHLDRLKRT